MLTLRNAKEANVDRIQSDRRGTPEGGGPIGLFRYFVLKISSADHQHWLHQGTLYKCRIFGLA